MKKNFVLNMFLKCFESLPMCLVLLSAQGAISPGNTTFQGVQSYTTSPVTTFTASNGHTVFDFGKEAAGWVEFNTTKVGEFDVYFGEQIEESKQVYRQGVSLSWGVQHAGATKISTGASVKGATIEYIHFKCTPSGTGWVQVAPTWDQLTSQLGQEAPWVIKPDKTKPVARPFRYVEIVSAPITVTTSNIRRVEFRYPYDMTEESFESDNANLNRVHDFCKYSIAAVSYPGYFVDGDRERKPYEADHYIEALSSFAISSDYGLPRRSFKYYGNNQLTWPHEWHALLISSGWIDWQWTGDTSAINEKWSNPLVNNCLKDLTDKKRTDGLLDTTGDGTNSGAWKTIVDWPEYYRYGYDYDQNNKTSTKKVTTVLNAFYYNSLRQLSQMATALGKTSEATKYASMADTVSNSFNKVFYDSTKKLYKDAEGSTHYSVHANAVAILFGLASKDKESSIADYLEQQGMKCSPYFAQYLLEALFKAGRAKAAINLMAANTETSWISMMDTYNATITLEAWYLKTMGPNANEDAPDMTHGWCSAPVNVISRCLLGATPASPGWKKANIKPQFGDLKKVHAKVPTAKGTINIDYENKTLTVKIPSGMTNGATVTFAGQTKTLSAGGSCTITEAGGGSTHTHTFGAWTTNTPPTCVAAGKRTRSCTGTGCSEKEEETLEPLGHDWGNWATNKVATTTQAGERTRSCRRSGCTATEKETIPMIEVEPTPADLPSTYQLLKSIQSTASGQQYINTGVSAGKGFKAELCFEATKPSENALMLGAYASGAEAYLPMIDPNGVLTIGVGTNNRQGSGDATKSNIVVVAIADDSGYTTTMKINGSLKVTTQNNAAPTSASLYLFASDNAKNGNVADHFLVAKLYYAKLYSSGRLVRYFVPAQEKSDNKRVGLYDLKGKSFYASVNSAFEAEGGSGGEEEPVTPPTDPTGRYTSKGASGAWASAANWTGVTDGTYPHLVTDEAQFPSSLTADTTLDLAGASYTLAAINAADGLNANLTLKNGSISVTDASYLKVNAAKALTFENMTISSSVVATDPSNEYKKGSFDPYVAGAKIVFKGANTISGMWLRNYKSGIGYVFQEGVTEVKKGFSFGGTVNPFTIDIRAARFVTSDFVLPNGSVAITIAPSALHTTGNAAWTLSGTFAPTAASTLTVDAAGLAAGTYTLISAKTLTDNAAFATKASVENLADGQEAAFTLANNTLTLTITGSGTPEPPPVVEETPQAGLHVWTAGDGLWTNSAAWTTKPEGGCWPDHTGALVRIDSSATIDLKGGSFRFAAMTNKGAAVTLKNGTLTQAKGLLQNEAASLTFENMTLVNETTAGGYADHAIRSYVDDATLAFVGNNTVRGYLLRSSNNNNTFKFKNGATTFNQGFDFGTSARTAALKIENATASFGGSLPTEQYTLNITMTFGAKNTGAAALLAFTGSFAPHASSTLTVDATGLATGTYTLISAGTFTDNAAFATKMVVEHVASGLTASVKLAENKLTLTLAAGGEPTHTDIKPSENLDQVEVKASTPEEACKAVSISAPKGIENKDYASYFKVSATEKSAGVYIVSATLDETKIDLDDSVKSLATDLGAGVAGESATIAAKPGLYYAVKKNSSLSELKSTVATDWKQAKSNTVELDVSLSGAKSGFYKVVVSPVGEK